MCDSRPTTLNGSDPAGGRFCFVAARQRVEYVMLPSTPLKRQPLDRIGSVYALVERL